MAKSDQAFRTIREVADWLGVETHVLRFWETKFSQVSPVKRAGGRRYYRPADMLLLGGIKTLLHDEGLTIRGVQKRLSKDGVKAIKAYAPPLDSEADTGPVSEPTGPEPTPAEQTPAEGAPAKEAQAKETAGEQPAPVSEPVPAAQHAPAAEVVEIRAKPKRSRMKDKVDEADKVATSREPEEFQLFLDLFPPDEQAPAPSGLEEATVEAGPSEPDQAPEPQPAAPPPQGELLAPANDVAEGVLGRLAALPARLSDLSGEQRRRLVAQTEALDALIFEIRNTQ